jgi:hypothetical protein
MFIECEVHKPFFAPEERNNRSGNSSPRKHCAPLEREWRTHLGIYKHSARPEPACYLVAAVLGGPLDPPSKPALLTGARLHYYDPAVTQIS